jgi:hypothetical protein
MFSLLIAFQVAVAQPGQPLVPVIEPSKRVAKIIARGNGLTKESAFRVRSVGEEYEILRIFGLQPGKQSLAIEPNGKSFDVIDVTNPRTGRTFDVWFDISSFYGSSF